MAWKNFSEETDRKIKWVRKMYSQWQLQRNEANPQDQIKCDLDDDETINQADFVYGVCRFVTEIKKVNGEQFPAKTLYEIVLCIQFHLEGRSIIWKLLGDETFSDLKYTLDNIMKKRNSDLVGYGIRKADVLSPLDQDVLWSMGLLGVDYPDQLLNTVVFYYWLIMCT